MKYHKIILGVTLILGMLSGYVSGELMHKTEKMPAAVAESVGMSGASLSRIDDVMEGHVDEGRIQGAVTLVARRGKVVHFSTHGAMDSRNGRAMEPDAIFYMASSTKPVIGAAVMILVDEGLIQLNDPVSKYIPEFANMKVAVPEPGTGTSQSTKPKFDKKPGSKQKNFKQKNFKKVVPSHRLVPVENPVTIHHLLTHTSGLMSGGLGAKVAGAKRTKDDSLESYVAKLGGVPLDFQPGSQWGYGNAGIHAVLPRIIEIVSQSRFEAFMHERMFKPLAMNNTYFNLPEEKESKRVVVLYKGQVVNKGSGGNGLSSTAEDFLHFQMMLLNGGELFGNRVLSPKSVEMMSSNQVGDLYANGKKGQKGKGFGYSVAVTLDPDLLGNYRGKGSFGWGGAGGTMSWTDPENELVGVIMLQQPRGSMQRDFSKAIHEALIP